MNWQDEVAQKVVGAGTYRCEYFKIKELVHPTMLVDYSEDVLWEVFDPALLRVIDSIRKIAGSPIIINNGTLVNCGLRHFDDPHYPPLDPHKFGRAFDLHAPWIDNKGLSPSDKMQAYHEWVEQMLGLFTDCCFEEDTTWMHIDTYNRPCRTFKDKNGGYR
jgi:hypothetical protein